MLTHCWHMSQYKITLKRFWKKNISSFSNINRTEIWSPIKCMSFIWHTLFGGEAPVLKLWRHIFIAITPRSTLTLSGNNCCRPILLPLADGLSQESEWQQVSSVLQGIFSVCWPISVNDNHYTTGTSFLYDIRSISLSGV